MVGAGYGDFAAASVLEPGGWALSRFGKFLEFLIVDFRMLIDNETAPRGVPSTTENRQSTMAYWAVD
jgi:hypothetical protein